MFKKWWQWQWLWLSVLSWKCLGERTVGWGWGTWAPVCSPASCVALWTQLQFVSEYGYNGPHPIIQGMWAPGDDEHLGHESFKEHRVVNWSQSWLLVWFKHKPGQPTRGHKTALKGRRFSVEMLHRETDLPNQCYTQSKSESNKNSTWKPLKMSSTFSKGRIPNQAKS